MNLYSYAGGDPVNRFDPMGDKWRFFRTYKEAHSPDWQTKPYRKGPINQDARTGHFFQWVQDEGPAESDIAALPGLLKRANEFFIAHPSLDSWLAPEDQGINVEIARGVGQGAEEGIEKIKFQGKATSVAVGLVTAPGLVVAGIGIGAVAGGADVALGGGDVWEGVSQGAEAGAVLWFLPKGGKPVLVAATGLGAVGTGESLAEGRYGQALFRGTVTGFVAHGLGHRPAAAASTRPIVARDALPGEVPAPQLGGMAGGEPAVPAERFPWTVEMRLSPSGRVSGIATPELPPGAIGRVTPPTGFKPGTTLFGEAMHERMAAWFRTVYPTVALRFRTGPGQKGIDVEVLRGDIGFSQAEFKPRTGPGLRAFERQMLRWGYEPAETRAFTYTEEGYIYLGW